MAARRVLMSEAINALQFIPPDIDRETWLTLGMASKDGGLSFYDFDSWSSTASSYNQKQCQSVWRSIKRGGVTVATLFHIAKQYGYKPNGDIDHKAVVVEREKSRQRQIQVNTEKARLAASAREQAETILSQCHISIVEHPYLAKKRISPKPSPLLDSANRIIIPVTDIEGNAHSLQAISPDGRKKFLPNGAVKSHFYQIWTGSNERIVICEGYATAVTLYSHYTPNYSVFIAFNAGNLLPVAKVLREAFPDSDITIAGDCDASGVGQEKAEAAALAVNGNYTIPIFQTGESGSDFNDRWCLDNPKESL